MILIKKIQIIMKKIKKNYEHNKIIFMLNKKNY